MKNIQMVDLKTQYNNIKSDIDSAISNVIDNTAFINFESGQLQIRPTKECYAQQFFNVNLNQV